MEVSTKNGDFYFFRRYIQAYTLALMSSSSQSLEQIQHAIEVILETPSIQYQDKKSLIQKLQIREKELKQELKSEN